MPKKRILRHRAFTNVEKMAAANALRRRRSFPTFLYEQLYWPPLSSQIADKRRPLRHFPPLMFRIAIHRYRYVGSLKDRVFEAARITRALHDSRG